MLPALFLFAVSIPAASIPTAQYNNQRTGANTAETALAPRNVNASSFGKLFILPVDGDVYAQPLYIPNLGIPGKGAHDVVFIATEHNSVYAFDAAGAAGGPLWRVNFGEPVPAHVAQCSFIAREIGITPTPVIDVASRTIYLIVRTAETHGGQERYYQRLHALDIATGAERPGSPVLIRATAKGSSWFGLAQADVSFHSLLENPRAAMLLSDGTVYIAWGSACDAGPYYGWVLGYDARTLKQTGVFNAAPDHGETGIWQSDTGIAADEQGFVYAITGNGKFNAASGGRDYGDSVLKLRFANGAGQVADYFTPSNEMWLNLKDADLGSGGPVLLPDRLMVAAGKKGMVYLLDRDRMGKYRSGSDAHALQAFNGTGDGIYGAPAYWNGHVYFFGSQDVLKDFALRGRRLTLAHQGSVRAEDRGATPVVSANGARDGIVWVVIRTRFGATLQASDAEDVGRVLFSDALGPAPRFMMPTVADGRVYVGVHGAVIVYGLRVKGPKGIR